jgi:hypothetical protein
MRDDLLVLDCQAIEAAFYADMARRDVQSPPPQDRERTSAGWRERLGHDAKGER